VEDLIKENVRIPTYMISRTKDHQAKPNMTYDGKRSDVQSQDQDDDWDHNHYSDSNENENGNKNGNESINIDETLQFIRNNEITK
jgi:hypothetical protein